MYDVGDSAHPGNWAFRMHTFSSVFVIDGLSYLPNLIKLGMSRLSAVSRDHSLYSLSELVQLLLLAASRYNKSTRGLPSLTFERNRFQSWFYMCLVLMVTYYFSPVNRYYDKKLDEKSLQQLDEDKIATKAPAHFIAIIRSKWCHCIIDCILRNFFNFSPVPQLSKYTTHAHQFCSVAHYFLSFN